MPAPHITVIFFPLLMFAATCCNDALYFEEAAEAVPSPS